MPKTRLCCFIFVCFSAFSEFVSPGASAPYVLTNAFPSLLFTNPVCLVSPPGENNRLFVVEKRGRIVVITNLAAPTRTIFMDISGRVTTGASDSGNGVGDERGLLGMAFHPGYATNGFFYLFYTGNATTVATGLHDILARFSVSVSNPNQGDANSEVRYILQYDQANNHNAGDLHFGPDGYLYISLGDEGGSYGQWGNSQKIDGDFFSAIMRLDVDKRLGSLPPNPHSSALPSLTNYTIPPDNPYIGATTFNGSSVNPLNVRTEFWAVGMRNPWRFSFDALTSDIYLGHVGQDQIEWVNIVTNKANCGWNFYEGDKQWTNSLPEGFTNTFTPPIAEYGHTNAPGNGKRNCIIGGIVYRGAFISQLYGAYLYADYGSGEIWALRYSGGVVTQNSIILTNSSAHYTAFGVDPSNGDPLLAAAVSGTNSIIQRITVPIKFPRITTVSRSGTNLVLSGTNGYATQTYYLVASTNLALPLTNWPPVATSLFDSSGNFSLTNPIPPVLQRRFYRIRVP